MQDLPEERLWLKSGKECLREDVTPLRLGFERQGKPSQR